MIIGTLLFILLSGLLLARVYCEYMRKRDATMHNKEVLERKNGINEKYRISKKEKLISRIALIADGGIFMLFKMVGYIPSHAARIFIYKHAFLMKIAQKAVIYYGLEARSPWNITIGEGTSIGDRSILDARHGIEIGRNVNLSTAVWMWTLQHDVNSKDFGVEGEGGKIVIEDRAWISSRATILPKVHIAEGVVIACGAVVPKDCNMPFTIWGGVPAKQIGQRNPEIDYQLTKCHRAFL